MLKLVKALIVGRIHRLAQAGLLNRWYEENFFQDVCENEERPASVFRMSDSFLVFVLAFGGLVVASFCLLLEICVHRIRR
jgi:hypothetical protein